MSIHRLLIPLSLSLLIILTACGANQPAPTADSTTPTALEAVTLSLGFVPNVQFAPFYVAQAQGFYAEEGLEVTLEYGFENDFVTLTAAGERDFAVASGDQVILAAAQDLPLVYVMAWYKRFPVGVAAKAESGIASPADLAGRTVGIPGLFGASYVAWEALVYAAELDPNSIELQSIGFTQAEALSQDAVDAAVVYVANEPVQLRQQGQEMVVFEVSDYIDLVSNGIVTNRTLLEERPELVGKLVRATAKGIAFTVENPDETFDIARQVIPEMTDEDAPTQRAVLEASIALWSAPPIGHTDPTAWEQSAAFMQETGLIEQAVDVTPLFTNQFLPLADY